jgi:hypothetical protein
MAETLTPAETAKRQQQAARQLILDYKAVFGSDKGKRVLADLHHLFQFERWEAEDTHDSETILRRVFMHGPLHHIAKQLRVTFAEKQKPKRALSHHAHETTTHPGNPG